MAGPAWIPTVLIPYTPGTHTKGPKDMDPMLYHVGYLRAKQATEHQFSDAIQPDRRQHRQRVPVARHLRLQLSATLHTLANVIDPARSAPVHRSNTGNTV